MINGGTCEASFPDPSYPCQNVINEEVSTGTSGAWLTEPGNAIGSWIIISLPKRTEITKIRTSSVCDMTYQMSVVSIDYGNGFSQNVSYQYVQSV